MLHVRSISEWAPLCIGPYAQANVLADSLIYLAGQIPLDPSTMTVFGPTVSLEQSGPYPGPGPSLDELIPKPPKTHRALMDALRVQLCLSLRHAARVLEPLNSTLRRALSCTVYLNVGVIEDTYGFSFPHGAQPAGAGAGAIDGCGSSSNSSSSTSSSSSSDIGSLSGWGGYSEIAALAERLLDCNCLEPMAGRVSCRVSSGGPDDGDGANCNDNDSDDESEEDSTRGLRRHALPVLLLGVRGIPRDCLVEVEVVACSELLPASSFSTDSKEYQLFRRVRVDTALDCPLAASEPRETATATACLSVSVEERGRDDLDPDYWPLWHRDQTCDTLSAGDDETVSVLGSGVEEVSSSSKRLEKSEVESATQLPYGVARAPYFDVHTSIPTDSVDILNDGETVLLANVRTVQSSRCVCSGFVSIHLRAAAPPEEYCGTNKNVLQNVLGAAVDLLVLGVAQQMVAACMTVDTLRTLRVYYQPDDLELEGAHSVGGGGLGSAESRVRAALVLSCHRILHAAVPFILVPVTHIPLVVSSSLNTPLLSANFLLFDLLQVKSEVWILGH